MLKRTKKVLFFIILINGIIRLGDGMEKIKGLIKKVFDLLNQPMMKILPGQLAFFMVLSTIPLITLVGSISSLFSISIDSIVDFLSKTLPVEIVNTLLPFVKGKGIDVNVIIFMFSGFMLASNGANSIILASNTLFHIEKTNALKMRAKAFLMTLLLVTLFFFTLVVLGLGDTIMNWILQFRIFSWFSDKLYFIIALSKYPIAFFIIYFAMKLIYTISPNKQISSKNMRHGAYFATLGFILVSAFYSYYVSHFTNYDLFYGSLSNIVILMLWVYILSYIMVLGIAINASLYEEKMNKKEKKRKE